ncbi:MAG: 5-oxoprolinase [Myxococcales bacterium]|nr:5-oxoprolinase [Myxococcales bacterium]
MLGVDTGGTFTDFVAVKNGAIQIAKIPSTPANPAEAILQGTLLLVMNEETQVIHGTTVATNAILERKGAKTALVTNAGLTHVLLIGRQDRPELYASHPKLPQPLIPRELCFGLRVRRNAQGEIHQELNEHEVIALAKELQRLNVEAVAVGFLHAYACDEDEKRVGAILNEHLPGVPISLSSSVLPVFREVERLMTTAMNASVTPKVSEYISKLSDGLGSRPLYLMQSNGGTLLPQQAQAQSIRLALSGPAGGVVAAFHLAKEVLNTDAPQLLTLDMGGTSTDVALCPGTIPYAQDHEMNGMPMALPVIDIHTVGAGGGSLVRLDAGGALQVGPQSAGAVPGPICYGHGGTQLTVTDANLFLGRLRQDWALGTEGEIEPEQQAVVRAVSALADEMHLPPEQVAQGILDVVNEHMVHALSKVSVQKGFDPRDFVLVPFGGAGPIHMCALAEQLNIQKIIIPPTPGVFSAVGLLLADRMVDKIQSLFAKGDDEALISRLEKLCAVSKATLLDSFEAQEQEQVYFEWELSLRYAGQSHEISVPLQAPQQLRGSLDMFHQRHLEMNGWQKHEAPEVVALTTRAICKKPGVKMVKASGATSPEQSGRLFDGEWQEVLVAERSSVENTIEGPAIVLQEDTTLWISEAWRGDVHASGALILTPKEGL